MMKNDHEQSFFNMGVAYLKRIDSILNRCVIFSMHDDVDNWLRMIRALYRELSILKLNDDLKKEYSDDFNDIYQIYNNGGGRRRKGTLLSKLDKLEIKLRSLAQQKGLLLPSKDDPRFAVLKR